MLQNLIQTRVEYSNIPVGPFGLPSRCCIVCQSVRAPYAQFSCLYSPSPTNAAKCAPLPSSWFPSLLRYYGYIGLPVAHLGSYRVPLVWFPYPEGDNRASSVLYEIAIIDLAKFSDRGLPQFPHPNGSCDFVCCAVNRIDHVQPHYYFPAQSLYSRFGSVSPCPTLKPDVIRNAGTLSNVLII